MICPHCRHEIKPQTAPLTPKQREIFVYVESFMREHGCAPSLSEIANALGMNTASTVHEHLVKLERKGVLERGDGPRNITLHVRSDELMELPAPSADATGDAGDSGDEDRD